MLSTPPATPRITRHDSPHRLWQNRQLINARFRAKPENRALFLSIFQQPTGLIHALRRMNQYGILRHLPAWHCIEGQMQYDLSRLYGRSAHSDGHQKFTPTDGKRTRTRTPATNHPHARL